MGYSVTNNLPASVGDAGVSGSLLGSGIPWRKKWQPTPVFLPGKFHGQRSLTGCTVHGVERVRQDLVTQHTHSQLVHIAMSS